MAWLSVLAGCCASARAIVIRDDVPAATALAAAANDHAVGKLLNRNRIDCSVTLISPRWALTAAHGLTDIRFPKVEIGGQRVAAARWYVHVKWNDNERRGFDIGLIRLARPITSVTPATLYRRRDALGQIARLVGYGDHGNGLTGATGFDTLRRAGSNTIDRVEAFRNGPLHMLVTDFDRPGDPDALLDEATTAAGDSGGPLLIGDAIAGITSWGSHEFSEYGDVARYTRVSSFVKWVDRLMRDGRRRTLRQAVVGRRGKRIFTRSQGRDLTTSLALHAPPAAVPEPAAALVLLTGLSLVAGRRTRPPAG